MVTPLGSGVDATWSRLVEGQSGANRITDFQVDDLACQIACQIPRGDGTKGTFNADDWMEPKDRRKVDDFILYGVAAAHQAVTDAGWTCTNITFPGAAGDVDVIDVVVAPDEQRRPLPVERHVLGHGLAHRDLECIG